MPEQLSSNLTIWYKFLPGFMGAGFAVAAITAPRAECLGLILFSAVSFAFLLYIRRCKTVSLVDRCLVVTSGSARSHVHVSRIQRVGQTHWQNPAVVTVALRAAQPAGSASRIAFIPKNFFAYVLDDGPITARLRDLAENASSDDCRHVTDA